MAYKNGYRTYESCSYAVNPTRASLEGVNDFSCSLYFQQEEHPEHFIYVNPGISLTPQQVKDTLFSCWREKLRVNWANRLAQLVERPTVVREVSGSSPRPDQHSGS